jgi:hypothetical protein
MYFATDAGLSMELLDAPSPELQRDGREEHLASALLELLRRELGPEIWVDLEKANVWSNPRGRTRGSGGGRLGHAISLPLHL